MEMSVTVRQIRPDDYDPIAEFLEKSTQGKCRKALWLDRFACWWEKNPAMEDNSPTGWALFEEDGEVKGFFGSIPIKYSINQKETVAYCTTSWYVEISYRKHSMKLLRTFLNPKKNSLLINSTSEGSFDIFKGLRFRQPGGQEKTQKNLFFLVDGFSSFSFLLNLKFPCQSISFFVSLFKPLLKPAINLYQKFIQRKLDQDSGEYSFGELDQFDDSHNLLWNRYKRLYDVIEVRDKTALNWLYFGSEDLKENRRILDVKYKNCLIAYVSIDVVRIDANGETYFYYKTVDLMVLEDKKSHYTAVLRGLYWLANNDDKKIMFIKTFYFSDKIEAYLSRFGFIKSVVEPRFLFKPTKQSGKGNNDEIWNNFYITPLDGDRGFFI